MVDQLIKNFEDAASFLTSQAGAGRDIVRMQEAQCCSLLATVNEFKLDFANGTRVTEAISAGPWTDEQRDALLGAVVSVTGASVAGKRNHSQECRKFETYLSKADWLETDGAKESHVKGVVFARAKSVDLVVASEGTIARMCAIVLCVSKRIDMVVTYRQLYDYYNEFKES